MPRYAIHIFLETVHQLAWYHSTFLGTFLPLWAARDSQNFKVGTNPLERRVICEVQVTPVETGAHCDRIFVTDVTPRFKPK